MFTWKVVSVYFLFGFMHTVLATHQTVIIVHGSFSKEASWHQCGVKYNFFYALNKGVRATGFPSHVVSFGWSGNLTEQDRYQAGQEFAQFIQNLPSTERIIIVSHSHGTNVVFHALHTLIQSRDDHMIECLYSLATPVMDETFVYTALEKINRVYHLFSASDFIQTVFGKYKQLMPAHENICNLQVFFNGHDPSHNQLHSPLIGLWLPLIHQILGYKSAHGFEHFTFNRIGTLFFTSGKPPTYLPERLTEEQKKPTRTIIAQQESVVHVDAHEHILFAALNHLEQQDLCTVQDIDAFKRVVST